MNRLPVKRPRHASPAPRQRLNSRDGAAKPARSWSRNHLTVALVQLLAVAAATGTPPLEGSVTPAPPSETLIALHYQDILAQEPPTVDLLIPPPRFSSWNAVAYSAEPPCLAGNGIYAGEPDQAIVASFEVTSEGNCAGRVEFTFRRGNETWKATAQVVATRLAPIAPLEGAAPTLRSDSHPLPSGRHTDLLLLGFTNPTTEPLTVLGIGDNAGFSTWIGQAYRLSGDANPTPTSAEGSEGFAGATLQPGETLSVALLIDPTERLPDGAGTITVRPVALVELNGELRTIEFPRLSSAWGAELP